MGERATREIWICGPGAYVVLKALAFSLRGENKDAYDLFYVLRNYGAGVGEIVEHLDPMRTDPAATEAMAILRRDFTAHDGPGPIRVAKLLLVALTTSSRPMSLASWMPFCVCMKDREETVAPRTGGLNDPRVSLPEAP